MGPVVVGAGGKVAGIGVVGEVFFEKLVYFFELFGGHGGWFGLVEGAFECPKSGDECECEWDEGDVGGGA